MVLDLVPIWTALLALAVFYYVVFDGFDLGVGILYGLVRSEADRRLVKNHYVLKCVTLNIRASLLGVVVVGCGFFG